MTAGKGPCDPASSRSERQFLPRPYRRGAAGSERPCGVAHPRTLIQPLQSPETALTAAGRAAGRIIARPPREPADQAPAAAGIAIRGDTLLLGRYRLAEKLGSGGFGVVWLAYDEQLRREVAVKRIPLGPGGDAERASREAQAAARLSHPAIVALYEAFADEDAFYLISELVRGSTLGRLIATGEVSDEQVRAIGLALSDGLAHAHARGVIHRDLKPQNVLVPDRGEIAGHAQEGVAAKLTDFGGASLMGEEALTRTGDVLGTLAYMSPEQSEGREVGEQSDLYALALVLYEAMSGHNPVRGATTAATARRIGTTLEPLRRHRPDMSPRLAEAIDVAVSPHPADRGALQDLQRALLEDRDGISALRTRRLRGARARRASMPREPLPARPLAEVPGTLEGPAPQGVQEAYPAAGFGLPRAACLALALLLAGWQAASGRPGLGLFILAALLPLLLFPATRYSHRVGVGWLLCVLAPGLGVIGLAGVFPVLAGQVRDWRERACIGALGYWWLSLAGPLLERKLWLPLGTAPPRSVWESSLHASASDVLGPLLALGVLLGAVLWGVAAAALPLLVRGRSAARDLLGATLLAASLVAFAPELDAGLSPLAHASGRGALLGAVLGGLLAVGARALRGPV
jgi:hypothetical protein